ncbi:MAG: PAS domain S-box protein [Candidatus Buchananbacteria bacterium]|nr:PAS domain S-box protein [Candidatus Buchananbacteria bacterium]
MASHELLENLDLVFDRLNDGLLLIELNGQIVKVNEALLKMGGYKREDLEGKNAMKLIKIFPPASLKKIVGSFADAMKGVPSDRYAIEAKTIKGEARVLELSNSLIKKQGRTIGVAVSIRDVTNKINLEGQLKTSEERYKILFESSRDAIMLLEPPSWKFTSANPATIQLFNAKSQKDFVSLGPWDVSPEKQPNGKLSANLAKEAIDKAMADGSYSFEWVHKKISGEEFPAMVLLTRMDVGGQQFLQAMVRDISKQKEAEANLAKRLADLERLNRLMVGRELKMIELKKELEKQKKST